MNEMRKLMEALDQIEEGVGTYHFGEVLGPISKASKKFVDPEDGMVRAPFSDAVLKDILRGNIAIDVELMDPADVQKIAHTMRKAGVKKVEDINLGTITLDEIYDFFERRGTDLDDPSSF